MKTNAFGDVIDEVPSGAVNAFGDPIEPKSPVPMQDNTGLNAAILRSASEAKLRDQGAVMGDGNNQLVSAFANDLATIPQAFKSPENATGNFGTGLVGGAKQLQLLPSIINALMVAGGDAMGLGETDLIKQNRALLEGYEQKRQQLQAEAGNSIGAQLGQGLAKGATELPLYLGPALLAKTPQAAVGISSALTGLLSSGQSLSQDLGQGMSTLDALPYALTTGGIDALATRLFGASGNEAVFANKGLPGVPKTMGQRGMDVTKHGLLEGAEESTAQVGQDLNERFVRNPNKTLGESVKDVGFAGLIGTLLGSGVNMGSESVNAFGDVIENQRVDNMSATFNQGAAIVPPRSFGGTQVNLDVSRPEGGPPPVVPPVQPPVTPPVVVPPVEPPKPVSTFDPEHESIAKVLDLKPEAGFDVPGMDKHWGFSPIGTKEVGTFYVKAGSTLSEVQKAWEAKKAAFEAGKIKPVETPVQPPVAVEKPMRIVTLESYKRYGIITPTQQVELDAWHKANSTTATVPPIVPTKPIEPVEPPKSVENKEETVNVQHGLRNLSTLLKHPGLDQSLRPEFQAAGDAIFAQYMQDFDHVAAKAKIEALRKEMDAATTKAKAMPVVAKPEWVRVLESNVKQGVATPVMVARLRQWHETNGTKMPEVPKPVLRSKPKQETIVNDPKVRAQQAAALGIEHGKSPVTALEKIAADEINFGAHSALAKFLLTHFKPALATVKVDLKTEVNGRYSPAMHKIKGLVYHTGNEVSGLLLHEGAHAATLWAITEGKTIEAKQARATLEALRALSMRTETSVSKTILNDKEAKHFFDYAHSNLNEFIAGLFDNQHFRDHLNEIKVEGNKTALDKAIDWIKQVLGIKQDSALAAAFDALIYGNRGNEKSMDLINQTRTASGLKPIKPLTTAKPKTSKKAVDFNDVEDAGVPWAGTGPDPLPFRYKDYAEEKVDATTARGIGTFPGLSRLFDPRSYKTAPEERVILTNGISKTKAEAGVATWLEQMKSKERAFAVDDAGQITLADGSKSYMSDVIEAEIENPGSQRLTPGQRAFVQEWKAINEEGIRYAAANGVKFFLDEDGNPTKIDDPHFPRPRTGTVGEENFPKSMAEGAKPGAKQGPFKKRYYETEAEGVAAKVKYEADEYNRIGDWLKAVYRSVADQKLADDPALKGRMGMRLVPSGIYDKNGYMTYSMVGHGPGYGEGEVYGVPALKGRVFSKTTADKLTAFYQNNIPNSMRFAIDINNRMKAIKFTMDVSAPFNQGLLMMYNHPGRWAKATALSYKAWMDDKTLSKYLNIPENAAAAREYVENGGSLVRLQDFLSGAEADKDVTKIKTVDKLIHTSARSMGTFLTIAKVEMYKALKPLAVASGTDLASLAEDVDNMIFSGRMEQIGTTQGRALMERVLFNAPSYLRAFSNLAIQGAKGSLKPLDGRDTTFSERATRNAIAGMMLGVGATMFAAYKAQGLSDDEIKERFDPRSGKFFRISIPMGEGKSVEMGYGNVILSFTRLLGDTVEIAQGTKSLRPGVEGNPWLRWLSYRKSPVVDAIWQGFTGKDFQGNDVGALEIAGRSIIPIPLEPMTSKLLKNEGTAKTASLETTAQFFGLNAFVKERPSLEEAAREKYGKSVGKLTVRERYDLKSTLDALPKPSMKDNERATIQATKNQFQRQKEVLSDLSSATQDFLSTNKLALPSFQSGFEVKGKNIPLSYEERKQHQAFVTDEYQKSLDALMSSPRIKDFVKDGSLQKRVNVILRDANERARLRLKRVVRTSGQPSS